MTVCAVIPSHNHSRVLPAIVRRLREFGLPVLIVDDGSGEPSQSAIAALHDPAHSVTTERLPINGGKGKAVIAGLRWAAAQGFTHALQVDADGQHDLDSVREMLALSRTHTTALILGAPLYDGTVPRARQIGRWLTHVWVFIETLSFRIRDSMCGLRIYPLASTMALLAEEPIGSRMDFDTDVVVRLFWRGVPPITVPVRVSYPAGNTSNFDVLADNWRITRMHTRLVLTLLWRLPSVLRHRPPRIESERTHWAGLGERGVYWGVRFVAAAYRLLGRRGCVAVMAPIVLYFYVTSTERRRTSREFLTRAFAAQGQPRTASWGDGFRHFMRFAARALDAFAAWTGAIGHDALVPQDPQRVGALLAKPQGLLLVVSHVGNTELCRALLSPDLRQRLTVLVHTRHAENYNRVLREFQPDAATRVMQVTEIGPAAAVQLSERIERGEWVAIAGDRIPIGLGGRTVTAPFLGSPAPFAQGPWLLASLLGCPVVLLFCRQDGGRWIFHLENFADRVLIPREDRQGALAEIARRYSGRLEAHCLADPFEWGNFFDFWRQGDAA
jgi:predicted LPLAT superfamily acyltransferase/glycosyltransferase involved in cell wall biosynthesis